MQAFLTFCVWLLASLSSGTMPPDDAAQLQGSWLPQVAELAGKPMDENVRKSFSLKLENGQYEVLVGDSPNRGTYSIDPTSKPKLMNIEGVEGPNKGRKFPAIYQLDGDTLRICYDLSGQKRPDEFQSSAGTKLYLVTYIRKKS